MSKRSLPQQRRDRWNSSSSEDEKQTTTKKKAPIAISKTSSTAKQQDNQLLPPPTPQRTTTPQQDAPSLATYNPLLQGCRSVYDTYERIARLDEGTYGVVWKAREIGNTQQIVALKQIKFDAGGTDDVENTFLKDGFPITALREISVLLALSHTNVVRVHEIVVGRQLEQVYMVMEFLDRDLKTVLETMNEPFSQGEVKHILQQVISGVEHLHSHWYLHRDLKTSNLLVDEQRGRIVVCDLGLARRYQEPRQALTQMVCTLWYRPPELLFGFREYGPEVDVWGLGCIFAEILTRKALLPGQGELDQTDLIFSLLGVPTTETWPDFERLPNAAMFRWKKSSPPQLAQRFPVLAAAADAHQQTYLDPTGFDLLSQMLRLDPKQRISARDALRHVYFSQGVKPIKPQFGPDGML